jgi:hypothetical protein
MIIHYSNSGGVGAQGAVGPTGPGGAGAETAYTVEGSTNITQPTFNGAPLFTGSSILTGELVYFRINVAMTNITSFGSGVYRVTIPFNTKYDIYVRGGHLADFSTSKRYAISGNALAGTNLLWLTTTTSNGEEVNFSPSVPINLAPEDDFHISGSYIKG